MVIEKYEVQVRTQEQGRQVLAGTQAMEFQAAADDGGRYAWIGSVLERFGDRGLDRADRGQGGSWARTWLATCRASRWHRAVPSHSM